MFESSSEQKGPEQAIGERLFTEIEEYIRSVSLPEGELSEESPEQFGNNFYHLFMDQELQEEDYDSLFITNKLREMERLYGDEWKKFLEENAGLVNEIQVLIRELRADNKAFEAFMTLYKNPKTTHLAERIHDGGRLHNIRVQIWDRLNPLLETASKIMRSYGIEPEEFYS